MGLLKENDVVTNNSNLVVLYDLQLQTKGMLLNNYQHFKASILNSNDTVLVKKYYDFLRNKLNLNLIFS